MDLFKLLFEHDMLLDENGTGGTGRKESTLEDFLKPQPTFSRFYFSGTVTDERLFGLDQLQHFNEIANAIDMALGRPGYLLRGGRQMSGLIRVLENSSVYDAFVIPAEATDPPVNEIQLDLNTGVRQKLPLLRQFLNSGHKVFFIEQSEHGADLHLFSRENVYPSLFTHLKPLVNEEFRFFSINGKRAKSDRLFFFETWTLDRPPHGFEEVFSDTVL
jgi:hypothetical protein